MVSLSSLLLVLPVLHGAAPDRIQVITGAMIRFGSSRCQQVAPDTAGSYEWPGLIYARGTPPQWGARHFSGCSGADTFVLFESLKTGALWATGDQQALQADAMKTLFDPGPPHAAFKKAFGWELPNLGTLGPNVLFRYDAKKLKQLFDRLSMKPAEQVGALTAQQLYDLALKKRLARFARDAAFIKATVPKAKLAKLLKDYRAAIQEQGTAFDGPDFLKQVALAALPQDQEPETARNGQTLGTILRRMGDGTWPVVVASLKKVLADYDPELFKELGDKL